MKSSKFQAQLAVLLICFLSIWLSWVFVSYTKTFVKLETVNKNYNKNFDRYASYLGIYRWDSTHYYSIAQKGYHYTNACKPQNIVFFPAYPMFVKFFSKVISLDLLYSGYVVSQLFFILACILLFGIINHLLGPPAAIACLLGLNFSAGTYAFHSFYSESTFLLFLTLSMYYFINNKYLPLALSCFILGASRPTGLAFTSSFFIFFIYQSYAEVYISKEPKLSLRYLKALRMGLYSLLCQGGYLSYLGYIYYHFGNPLKIIPEIYECQWSKATKEMSFVDFFTFRHLADRFIDVLNGSIHFLLNIQAVNFIWTFLAAIAAFYSLFRFKHWVFKISFFIYFCGIYKSVGASELLVSTHRYFVLMIPIYLMLADIFVLINRKFGTPLAATYALALIIFGVAQMFVQTTLFTAGVWWYF